MAKILIAPYERPKILKTISKIFLVSESQTDPIDQMQEKKNIPSKRGVSSVSDFPFSSAPSTSLTR